MNSNGLVFMVFNWLLKRLFSPNAYRNCSAIKFPKSIRLICWTWRGINAEKATQTRDYIYILYGDK
jgi:hypothetical protein